MRNPITLHFSEKASAGATPCETVSGNALWQYLRQPNGTYQIGESFLTISLGEPYRGYAYKLIAAIIEP